MTDRPPLPPFTRESAAQKVQAAEDAWNTRDPQRVALAYSEDSVWRNRGTFVTGRAEIVEFLTAKWAREREYALRKDLWAYDGNRIAVRFQYECQDTEGQWWRSLRQRTVGVRRARADDPARGEHQRRADRGEGAPDPRPAPRGRAGAVLPASVGFRRDRTGRDSRPSCTSSCAPPGSRRTSAS